MFQKLNLCRRLVVPSQKIQSDLYIALHKFLVNLYNHLERESLLISQRTVVTAASVTETTRLYEAVPGTAGAAGGGQGGKTPPWGPHPAQHEGKHSPDRYPRQSLPQRPGAVVPLLARHKPSPFRLPVSEQAAA